LPQIKNANTRSNHYFRYLIGVTVFGSLFGAQAETTEDYFVGEFGSVVGNCGLIVVIETSTITFISVPGPSRLRRAAQFSLLQLVGYDQARGDFLLFIPSYFRANY